MGIQADFLGGGQGRQVQENYLTFDEGGEVTFSEKSIIPREERQKVKDFLSANPSKLYNIFDEKGRLVKSTSGRNVYPDILKFSLAGSYSIAPARGQAADVSYLDLGVGNIVAIPKGVYGPPTKQQGAITPRLVKGKEVQGPPDLRGPQKTPYQVITGQFARPVKNLYMTGKTLVTGVPQPTTPTQLERAIETGSAILQPAARDLLAPGGKVLGVPGLVRQPTQEERAQVTKAGPNFLTQATTELKTNPQEFIVPLAGEAALWVAAPVGGGRLVGIVAKEALKNKVVAQAIVDFRGIFAPKQIGQLTIKEKIPVVKTIPKEDIVTTYHGTDLFAAKNILKVGLERDRIPSKIDTTVFVSGSKKYAEGFAKYPEGATIKNPAAKGEQVVLKIESMKNPNTLSQFVKTTIGKEKEILIEKKDIIKITVASGPKSLKGKSWTPTGTSLSKDIAGKGLVRTPIDVQYVGGNVVRVEAQIEKQKVLALYNIKTKKFGVLSSREVGEVSPSYRLRGSLSDPTQKISLQTSQQEKFGVTQIDKDLFATSGKVRKDLIKAISADSDVVTQIGTFKIYTLQQARQNPRLFGRYVFGGEAAPVKPKADIGLLESIGFRTGGTSIGKEIPTKGIVKTGLDIVEVEAKKPRQFIGPGKPTAKIIPTAKFVSEKRDVFGNVFKPFKERTINLESKVYGPGNIVRSSFEKFRKKLPTSSFVTDVQKNIRIQDPFSKVGKQGSGGFSDIKVTKPSPPSKPETKVKQILTTTKEQRDIVQKEELDILFQKPRFTEAYGLGGGVSGSLLLASTSTERYPRDIYGNRMVESPNEKIFSNLDSNKLNISPEKSLRSKLTPGTISDIIPKRTTGEKLKTNVIPLQTQKPSYSINPSLIPKVSIITIPITGTITTPKTTPVQIPKTTPDLVPKIPTPVPEKIIPPIIPIFGLPPGPRGGRDFDSPSPPLGSNLDWRGNVPEFDIVGIYGKRKETTYTIGKVPGLKRKDKRVVAKPIKGFGSSNIQSLNITNKTNSFSGKGKSKANIFRGVSAKKFRF